MALTTKSRWADNEEDTAIEAQRKEEKEQKKRAKAEKQRQQEAARQVRQEHVGTGTTEANEVEGYSENMEGDFIRPAKRRRLSSEPIEKNGDVPSIKLLRYPALEWSPCRHIDNFEKLNHIEEGSYGWVSRAREIATGEVVALKKLKMDNSHDGFPVTGLREIQTLMESRHENIVNLREVVMGDSMSEYVSTQNLRNLL